MPVRDGSLSKIAGAVLSIATSLAAVFAQYNHTLLRNYATSRNWALVAGVCGASLLLILLRREMRDAVFARRAITPPRGFRWLPGLLLGFVAVILWSLLTLHLSRGGVFTPMLLLVWLAGIVSVWIVLNEGVTIQRQRFRLNLRVTPERLTFVIVLICGLVVAYYRIDSAPRGMIPDHVEIILDLVRINEGLYSTYFGANSGREPLFFYMSYGYVPLFGYSFLTLKHASTLSVVLCLPSLYVFGREVDGRMTGLLTMALGAFSVWMLITGRSGFRAALTPLFVAMFLTVFWRALYDGRRSDYVFAGLILGLGQYTYTSFRIVPLVVVVGVLLRLMVAVPGRRRVILENAAGLVAMSLVVFLPLFAFWMARPDVFWYRANVLAGADVFEQMRLILDGFWQTITMFNVTIDPVYLNIIPAWPAVGPVVGGLWLLGAAVWIVRVLVRRDWLSLLLPLAFLILLLPSAMAVSSPAELPSARRAVTALPIILLFAAIGLAFLIRVALQTRTMWGRTALIGCTGAFLLTHMIINVDAFFNDYAPLQSRSRVMNVAIAEEILAFERDEGAAASAYIVFDTFVWADARIVAVELGRPLAWDNVIFPLDPAVCEQVPSGDGPFLFVYSVVETNRPETWLNRCFESVDIWQHHDRLDGRPLIRIARVSP